MNRIALLVVLALAGCAAPRGHETQAAAAHVQSAETHAEAGDRHMEAAARHVEASNRAVAAAVATLKQQEALEAEILNEINEEMANSGANAQ